MNASTAMHEAPHPVEADEPAAHVIITPRAARKMAAELARRGTPDAAVRFGIRGGGCTGYTYDFSFEDRPPRASDHRFEVEGVTIYVDAKSMLLLDGTIVDFETGIRGHGFRFDNPNVKTSCGCGESITF